MFIVVILALKVMKMVTNPKTYLVCSLKGLYRKADSFRKDHHSSNKDHQCIFDIIIIKEHHLRYPHLG